MIEVWWYYVSSALVSSESLLNEDGFTVLLNEETGQPLIHE